MSDLSSNNFLTSAHYIIEPKKAVMKGNGKMSKKTSNNMICAATAMVAGGIAFAATKAMTSNKTQNVKKATGKAIKAVGAVIESLDVTGLQQKAVHEPFLVSGRLLSVGTIIIAAFKNKYIRHQANNKARVGLTLRRYGVIIDFTIKR